MYLPFHNCFRNDLIIVRDIKSEENTDFFLVYDPNSEKTLRLSQEELFLCQLMDGRKDSEEIAREFENQFGFKLKQSDLEKFSDLLSYFGFLNSYESQENWEKAPAQRTTGLKTSQVAKRPQAEIKASHQRSFYQIKILNPKGVFQYLAKHFYLSGRVVIFVVLSVLSLSLVTIINNFAQFWLDLATLLQTLSIFITLPLGLILVHFGIKLIQGVVITSSGGIVNELGIELWLGIIPRFYVSRKGETYFSRRAKLWISATPLLLRTFLFSLGVLNWFATRSSDSLLVSLSLLIVIPTGLGFLADGCPLWKSAGYWWLTTYFRIPRLYERSMQVLAMLSSGRPLPESLSKRERTGLIIYAVLSIGLSAAIFLTLVVLISMSLESSLQGTGIVLSGLLIGLFLRWYLTMSNPNNHPKSDHKNSFEETAIKTADRANGEMSLPPLRLKLISFLQQHKWSLLGLAGLAVLLALPYRYSPGGSIKLLPPKEKEIQADISGKIVDIAVVGGNGEWVEQGTAIGQIQASNQLNPATPIKDDIAIIKEQIEQQKANLKKEQAQLNQLLNTPRPEEVEVAKADVRRAEENLKTVRQQLQVAKQNVEVATRELNTQITSADYLSRESARLLQLYQEGAISLQRYENAQRDADVRESEVEQARQALIGSQERVKEAEQNLKVQQKNLEQAKAELKLLLSGPHPDQVASAREDVAIAEARLRETQQDLKNTQNQLTSSRIVMPFDGKVVTPFLDQKEGTYVEQGDVVAVVENDRNIRGLMKVPEINVGEFDVGRSVMVKLSAYPNYTIKGEVVSIEPVAEEENTGNFVDIIIELPQSDRLLKSGMSGHAKIEGEYKPVLVVFTRPIVRFFQIEVWSWLP